MGYRDDLIQRFKDAGSWDQLTGEQQRQWESLTDEQARQIMVKADEWDMGNENTVQQLAILSLHQVITSFKSALFDVENPERAQLSKAGRLLAEFFFGTSQEGIVG